MAQLDAWRSTEVEHSRAARAGARRPEGAVRSGAVGARVLLAAAAVTGCMIDRPFLVEDTDGGSSTSYADGSSSTSATEGGSSYADESTLDDTGTEPACGNGIVELGESCEDGDLAGGTCEGLGFGPGTLSCSSDCSYVTSECSLGVPVLQLGFSQVKRFDFSWRATGADYYQLLESASPGAPFVQVGGDIIGESVSVEMPLHFRSEASYVLRGCNDEECKDSAVVDVMSSLADAVGYFKASNTAAGDGFGVSVALSGDGNTLAVSAHWEASNATGIDGDQTDDSAAEAGAVYVFVRDGMGGWSQQAYVKASNTDADDGFGRHVALSGDGNTLAVSAIGEDSNARGIDGDQTDDSVEDAGAVYVFVRDGRGGWSQNAYVKASNTDEDDHFGWSMALSGDGNTLAVGAAGEQSTATGIDGDQTIESGGNAGAVYVFVRDGMDTWSQQAYVKASNTGHADRFGMSAALSADGNTLAVGAESEDSNATGIDGDQTNNSRELAGAVYVFVRDGMDIWSQQAYVKASNTDSWDIFSSDVALSGDGNTLAVGAVGESSSATGIDGDQADDSSEFAGAVYVFVRDGMDTWSQQAYVKASNTDSSDSFGTSVALSGDGDTLVVGALGEDSGAIGIGGDQSDESTEGSGAAYVFVRDGMGTWSQAAYVKAPTSGELDIFAGSVASSADGTTLAIVARGDDGNATGVGGDQAKGVALDSGAVYVY